MRYTIAITILLISFVVGLHIGFELMEEISKSGGSPLTKEINYGS